jgi:two-component system sensor histidine kinase BaeS
MRRRIWVKLFILLIIASAVAFSTALVFRHLVLADFARFQEGEMLDRTYWVTGDLEASYERHKGWQRETVAQDVVWALLLGLETRVYDQQGTLLMDTAKAISTLSPLASKRVYSMRENDLRQERGEFEKYPLYLAGKEIGLLEVRRLDSGKEILFVTRANRFLLMSALALGGLAVVLSIIIARRFTAPVHRLAEAAEAIGHGNLKSRVPVTGNDEIATLSRTFNRMAETLELQENLRKRLYANAAHELRTPLAAMRGELEGMMDGLFPTTPEQLASLHEETGRLASIVEGVEALIHAEATPITLKRQLVPVAAFFQNLAKRYSGMFAEKGVSLEIHCSEKVSVWADPDKLRQVMVNLVANALRATGEGGSVRLEAEMAKGGTLLRVRDTGRGISADDLPFIFERFFRGKEGGHGIGLAIVKEIIEGHGGTIEAHSTLEEGALFTVFLPDEENS